MKTKNQIDPHRKAFIEGQFAQHNALAGCTPENPYISTSNSSDAFWLGVQAAKAGLPTNCELRKSRGYTWIMAGAKYLVEGEKIQPA